MKSVLAGTAAAGIGAGVCADRPREYAQSVHAQGTGEGQ